MMSKEGFGGTAPVQMPGQIFIPIPIETFTHNGSHNRALTAKIQQKDHVKMAVEPNYRGQHLKSNYSHLKLSELIHPNNVYLRV